MGPVDSQAIVHQLVDNGLQGTPLGSSAEDTMPPTNDGGWLAALGLDLMTMFQACGGTSMNHDASPVSSGLF
eukprot:NODE_8626_length_374_cov_177.532915.p2 GENE.NODE_8626_length_374_cov_177.532915~~NODE_8626_length_374_cov_177.532915.p2  ORF type:complete len:72 (+),score=29.21 NODE_8626_length_374_cov_177.532915:3-218(+)